MRAYGRGIAAFFGLIYRNHNLLIVAAAFATMVALAVISGYWLFYRAAYVIGGLVPVCFLWARGSLRKLDVTVQRAADRALAG